MPLLHASEQSVAEPNPADNATRKSAPPPAPETVTPGQTGSWAHTNASQSSKPPSQIGRFEVRQLLGEGAFARVYLGFDSKLEREVAIKVPKASELTPELHETFVRENRLAAIIHHANICPIYEVGTDNGLPYLVMRMVPDTLAEVLKRQAMLMPPRNAIAIARKLALGLAAAHAQKVIHRDLKPANILYDEANREVLIADFGLARFADQATAASNGVPKGTPAYMAPEQARGQAAVVGPLSDVYSLGVILYEMLTGRTPFSGSVWEVMRDHCETPPIPPSSVRFGLDPRLDAICLKAMAKNPADRYNSAKDFGTALANYLRGAEQSGSSETVPSTKSTRTNESDQEIFDIPDEDESPETKKSVPRATPITRATPPAQTREPSLPRKSSISPLLLVGLILGIPVLLAILGFAGLVVYFMINPVTPSSAPSIKPFDDSPNPSWNEKAPFPAVKTADEMPKPE